jgi:hypothetical protein
LVGNYLLEPSSGDSGFACFEPPTVDPLGYGLISGAFVPYTAIPGSEHCAQLYPTRGAYTARVARAATDLANAGFLLEDEIGDAIAAAEAAADEHPGCVPRR